MLQRHPTALDAGVVALLLLTGVPSLLYGNLVRGPSFGRIPYILICLPLLARRAHPVAAVLGTGLVGLVQLVLGSFPSLSDLALAVAVYTAVAYGPPCSPATPRSHPWPATPASPQKHYAAGSSNATRPAAAADDQPHHL